MYKSLHDYKAARTMNGYEVLSIKRGETLEFLETCNEHWWKMRSADSDKVGLVPASYLEETKQVTLVG